MPALTSQCQTCHAPLPVVGGDPCPCCGTAAYGEAPAAGLSTADPADTGPYAPDPDLAFLGPPQRDDEIGRLGPYRVLGELGRGGMGVVLRAEEIALGRPVALKALLPRLAADPDARRRFVREARAAAAVDHDHVVPVYAVGEDRGVPYLAMPLLRGRTIAAALRDDPRPPLPEVVRVGLEIAEGLAAAHAKGLVHRDIKPANLWLDATAGGRVKILDFGLARGGSEGIGPDPVTGPGVVLGTPSYMSPEQARGREVDARTDLFSLGVTLYQMLTGALPFRGPDAVAVLTALATDHPPPPVAVDPRVPPALSALVLRLLAKDPAGRPATAQAVADALRVIESGLTPAGGPARSGRRRAAGLAAALVMSAAAGGWVASTRRHDGTAPVPPVPAGELDRTPPGQPTPGPPATNPAGNPDPEAASWVRQVGGRVVVECPGGHRSVGPGEPLPEGWRSVQTVDLNACPGVTDAGLACLGRLPRLEVVALNGTKAGDAGLARLAAAPCLADLQLADTRVTDAGLQHLAGVRRLWLLNLTGTQVTDAGTAHLAGLAELVDLNLHETKVGDGTLRLAAGWPRLRILYLTGSRVTDAGLAHLGRLPELESLGLNRTTVGDDGLSHLAGVVTLRDLQLADTGVTDAGVARLSRLTALESIDFSGTRVGDGAVLAAAGWPRLRALNLGRTRVTDEGLAVLAGLRSLADIDLGRTRVSVKGVAALRRALPDCRVKWDGVRGP